MLPKLLSGPAPRDCYGLTPLCFRISRILAATCPDKALTLRPPSRIPHGTQWGGHHHRPFIMAAHSNGQAIIFCSCGFYLLLSSFSSPNLSGRSLDVFYTWCGLSANLECMFKMCCTRLAENYAKNRHLRTIAQLRQAVSSQLRHVSTS